METYLQQDKDTSEGSMDEEWRRARAFYKAVFHANPPSYVIDEEEEFAAPKGRVRAACRHGGLSPKPKPKQKSARKRSRTSAKKY